MDANRLFEQANAMFMAGNLAAAEGLYKQVLRIQSFHPGANLNLAQLVAKRCDHRLALRHARSAWQFARGNETFAIVLIECLLRSEMAAEASRFASATAEEFNFSNAEFVELCHSAKQIAGGLWPSLTASAPVLQAFQQREYARSAELLNPLLESYPEWAQGWALKGAAIFLHSDCTTLLKCSAQELFDSSASLATFDFERSEALDVAIAHLGRALQLQPTDLFAQRTLSKAIFERSGDVVHAASLAKSQNVAPLEISRHELLTAAEYCESRGAPYSMVSAANEITVPAPRFLGDKYDFFGSIGTTRSNETYFAEMTEASFFAKHEEILTSDGIVISDKLSHPLGRLCDPISTPLVAAQSKSALLLDRSSFQTKKVPTAIPLTGVSTHEFGHWMGDYLPRIKALEKHPEFHEFPIYIDADMPASHIEALQLMVGAQQKIIQIPADLEIRADRIIVSSASIFFPYFCKAGVPSSVHIASSNAEDLHFLRGRILGALGIESCGWSRPGRGRRLFLTRKTSLRRLVNQAEIAALLCTRYGFESISPETLSFAEQVRTFSEAEFVVGANSSAFANVIFSPVGTKVVSLSQAYAGNMPSWAAALGQLGVEHLCIAGRALPGTFWHEHQLDYSIPLELIETAMQAWGV